MSSRINLDWTPPGPVSERFMASTAFTQILNGPIGSGKTTTNFMKHVENATKQQRSSRDGVRKYKLCVVRDTYRELWKTTIPSWWKRFPQTAGVWVGAVNAPAKHTIKFRLDDGSIVDFQVEFAAIGENSAEDFVRGYEPTAWYLNEADLLANDVYTFCAGRAGRFPDMEEGGPTWRGVTMDCNAPVLGSWLYREHFLKSSPDVELFRQPSGLSPDAENLVNLPVGYYTQQLGTAANWYIERMIKNRPGFSRAGKPVYPEFNDQLHVATQDLLPVTGLRIGLGLDAGMRPAATINQRMPNGQRRTLDELCSEPGTGPARFANDLWQLLNDRYQPWLQAKAIDAWADPSAAYGADTKAGEATWIQIVANKLGIPVLGGPTNSIIPRLAAVQRPLSRMIDGQPGYLLSPRCAVVREGFNSTYRYRKIQTSGDDERFAEEIDKNDASHPHDSLQYWCSGDGEDLAIRQNDKPMNAGANPGVQADFDPYADRSTWPGASKAGAGHTGYGSFDPNTW